MKKINKIFSVILSISYLLVLPTISLANESSADRLGDKLKIDLNNSFDFSKYPINSDNQESEIASKTEQEMNDNQANCQEIFRPQGSAEPEYEITCFYSNSRISWSYDYYSNSQ